MLAILRQQDSNTISYLLSIVDSNASISLFVVDSNTRTATLNGVLKLIHSNDHSNDGYICYLLQKAMSVICYVYIDGNCVIDPTDVPSYVRKHSYTIDLSSRVYGYTNWRFQPCSVAQFLKLKFTICNKIVKQNRNNR